LIEDAGVKPLFKETVVDDKALDSLRSSFKVDEKFAGQPHDELAISRLVVVGKYDKL